MAITPTNNLAKLGIGAAHAMRIELADQLFFPIAVSIINPSQPMMGGYVGNRGGQAQRLSSPGPGGNTGGYGADFGALEGDPISVVKTMTSDGPIFTLQKYDGTGIITVENPNLNTTQPVPANQNYSTVARYLVKADGFIYDLLELRATDTTELDPNDPPANPAAFAGPYRHWELAAAGAGVGYAAGTNTYTPPITPANINLGHYQRRVGQVSFRPKEGASAAVIQENLSRAQSTLDLMSRMLRSLHDECKGPFANLVVR